MEAADPTIYVIHNLLTRAECRSLVQQAAPRVQPLTRNDPLQHTTQYDKFVKTERVHLWQGMLQGPERKAVEERIEQVTGFPSDHFSDWTVDRLKAGSYWQPHYDTLAGNYVPMATITVFLSAVPDGGGGEIVYPSTNTEPVMIRPVQGMAVVHHNTDEKHQFDVNSLHALLPIVADSTTTAEDVEFYVATKYILPLPVSKARRIALPVFAALTGGRLPDVFVWLHDALVEQFGVETGGVYFDKLCVFVPVLIVLGIAQFAARAVHRHVTSGSSSGSSSSSGGGGGKKAPTPTSSTRAASQSQPRQQRRRAKRRTDSFARDGCWGSLHC